MSKKTYTRRKVTTLVAAMAASAMLAACGAGGQAQSSGNAASDEKTSLTVLRTNGGQFEGILLGKEKGIWAENGLTLDDKIGADSSAQRVPPLLNKEAHFAQIDATAMIRAAAEGLPVQIVGSVQIAPDTGAAGFKPADGLMVPPNSPIKSLKDLAGKTVGVPALGATIHVTAMLALEKAGVDPKSVKFIALPAANLLSSAEGGQVDAVTLWSNFYGQAQSKQFTVIGPSAGEVIKGIPQIVWASSKQYANESPKVVEQFLNANAKAQDYANSHPEDRRRLMGELTKLPKDYIQNVWLVPFSNQINRQGVQELADALKRFGFIDKAPAMDDIIWKGAQTA